MIIEKKQRTVGKITYDYLFHTEPYYAVGYGDDLVIIIMTPEDEPVEANLQTASIMNGFGADTYQELLDEIERRGLIFPDNS